MMRGLAGAELRRGIVRVYAAGPPKVATVEMVGSLTSSIAGIPVAKGIADGDMSDGAKVLVVMFDEHNPAQSVVVAVYG